LFNQRGDLERGVIRTSEYDFLVKTLLPAEAQSMARSYDTAAHHLGQWKVGKKLIACINPAHEPIPTEILQVFLPSDSPHSSPSPPAHDPQPTSPEQRAKEDDERFAFETFDLFPDDGTTRHTTPHLFPAE